jgi:membrane-bound inhibitor of C-type lysozyme
MRKARRVRIPQPTNKNAFTNLSFTDNVLSSQTSYTPEEIPITLRYDQNGQKLIGVSASGISVINNNVYVSGTGYNGVNGVAKFWKNGASTNLSDGSKNAIASSIFVVKP